MKKLFHTFRRTGRALTQFTLALNEKEDDEKMKDAAAEDKKMPDGMVKV